MEENKNLEQLRHSTAHLLAAAVLSLYPDTKLTIGPAIENGFYYDFEFSQPISEDDLDGIENKMRELLPVWTHFSHREVSEKVAKEFYKNNPYKQELIDEIVKKGEKITFYKCGQPPVEFEDLCRGGHAENPAKEIGALKLLNIAGAYWRGSEKNTMLTRIYGTAFPTQKELDEYLNMLEEAKKRDHKKLGPQLDLFMFADTAPGMAYWLPKGLIVYNTLLDYSRAIHKQFGYQEVATPLLNKKELYETSGHWQHYRDDMFVSDMGKHEVFGIKPMNCPNAMMIFGSKIRSYRELPLRFSETSNLHRFELSGTLNGLFRIRQFTQDDAHLFVTQSQIKQEFQSIMEMIEILYSSFHLSYRLRFGTRSEKFMGEAKDWDMAESSLENVLKQSGKEYFVADGEGAFYGPKVDILMKDSLGREWQTGTIQLDFQQPKNFKLAYIDEEGKQVQPAVIHRALYGSFERFLGILIEHYAGALPLWLAPTQFEVLPISDKFLEEAEAVKQELLKAGLRADLDNTAEPIGAKIRRATLQKVPYLCIIGQKEVDRRIASGKITVSVRTLQGQDQGHIELDSLIQKAKNDIETRL